MATKNEQMARETFERFEKWSVSEGLSPREWVDALEELESLVEGALDAAREEADSDDD